MIAGPLIAVGVGLGLLFLISRANASPSAGGSQPPADPFARPPGAPAPPDASLSATKVLAKSGRAYKVQMMRREPPQVFDAYVSIAGSDGVHRLAWVLRYSFVPQTGVRTFMSSGASKSSELTNQARQDFGV